MPRLSRRSLAGFGFIACLAAALAIRMYVAVPSDGAAIPVAHAVLGGSVGTPPLRPIDPGTGAVYGGECLPRMARDGGWLDLCWEGYFWGRNAGGTTDYYVFRMYGSHQGWRWMSLRNQVIGGPKYAIFSIWPDGTYEGGCRQEPVSLIVPMGNLTTDDVCGRTEAHASPTTWSDALTWTCERCLVPDGSARGVSMYAVVGVVAGTVPSWDIFANGGS